MQAEYLGYLRADIFSIRIFKLIFIGLLTSCYVFSVFNYSTMFLGETVFLKTLRCWRLFSF